MATGKSCSRQFAPALALLMAAGLNGCFDKEDDQHKTFIDPLQNTIMCSGERLPTLTTDQRKQFGPFVSDYTILYGYSQRVNQVTDSGLRPVVSSVNAIRTPQDYVTRREPLCQISGALSISGQQLQNAKLRADAVYGTLKQGEDLEPAFDQVYNEVVTAPVEALQPLIPTAQIFTQQLVQVGDFMVQRDTQVSSVANDIRSPTSQQANQYNTLIGSLAAQHQTFNQVRTAAVNTAQ